MYPNGVTNFRRNYFCNKKLTAPQKAFAKQARRARFIWILLFIRSFRMRYMTRDASVIVHNFFINNSICFI